MVVRRLGTGCSTMFEPQKQRLRELTERLELLRGYL